MRAVVSLVVLLIVLAGGIFAARTYAIASAEKKLMIVHRNGTATPAQFGAAWTPFFIDSDGRRLDASLVMASSSCASHVAVLLVHGRDESLSDWAKAQAFLSKQCVSSIMFDYSGNGDSPGTPNVANLNADVVAAYGVFVQKFPKPWRRCVLGHSMGNALMLHGFPSFTPAPDCVVVANAFSSVEDFARAGGAPSLFALLLRGVWDNTEAIKRVNVPLLVVHSDADQTIPASMPKRLEDAAPRNAERVTLHGFSHDALYENPNLDWWKPVVAFLKG
jgi:alpha-beta hydrolase superfamily lysophospholipase